LRYFGNKTTLVYHKLAVYLHGNFAVCFYLSLARLVVFLKARTPLANYPVCLILLSLFSIYSRPRKTTKKAPFACAPRSVHERKNSAGSWVFCSARGNLNKAHAGAKEIQISLLRREPARVFTICKEMASPPSSYFGASARQHKHSKERWRKQSNFSHSPPNPRAADDGLLLWMYACSRGKPQIKSFSHTGPISSLGKLRKTSQSERNLHTIILRASFVSLVRENGRVSVGFSCLRSKIVLKLKLYSGDKRLKFVRLKKN
jgi:hypothetical protein